MADTRMNPQETEALSVTQADRNAAADYLAIIEGVTPILAAKVRDTGTALARAFARHRLSHSTPGDAEVRAEEAARAWKEVAEIIEAHLKDRVAMRDEANPAAYLRIVQSAMARVDRSTEQLLAARWASERRLRDEVERLSALATPSGRAQGEWRPIETAVQWDVAIVTDGENIAVSQLCESDHGDWYWSAEPEDALWFEPTHWRPDDRPAAPPAQDQGDEA